MSREKIILGEDCIYEKNGDINQNVLVCGSSGCGKTMSVLEPRLLETVDTSLIITISKRRLVKQYTELFLNRGYQVYDLNFIHPEESNVAYDPLAYIKNTSDIVYLAQAIANMETRKAGSKADPYWDQCAVSLLSAEIGLVMLKINHPTFSDVLKLHDMLQITEADGTIQTTIDGNFEKLSECENDALSGFVQNAWRTFRQVPIRTASCIFSTLNATLDTIFTPELRKMMDHAQKVDFEKIANEKSLLFISVSAVNPALNQFVNLFYAQSIKQLFEYAETHADGILPVPVHMLCDDFACGSRILNFPEYISIFREKGISVTLLLQSESQLSAMYEEDATTIINNCDTYLYMGGMDLKTCINVSTRLNIPLDEVLYMPVGKVVVFRRGERPVVTNRYNIEADRRYQDVTRKYRMKLNREREVKERLTFE